jgi:hypothetical protein
MVSSLGDQKKNMINDKAEIERLQRDLTAATEQRIELQQRLEESHHEIAELQKKIVAGMSDPILCFVLRELLAELFPVQKMCTKQKNFRG